MSQYDQFMKQSLLKYKHPDIARRDVLNVLTSFTDLRPQVEEYVFTDGTKKSLLQLDGTIPVTYKGSTYNIPICIWILDTHPSNAPMVYVRPTYTMKIKSSKNVDQKGQVYLPYLHEWRYPNSDLIGIIQSLALVFSEEPPLYNHVQQPLSNTSHNLPQSGDLPMPLTSVVGGQSNNSNSTFYPAYPTKGGYGFSGYPGQFSGYPGQFSGYPGHFSGYPRQFTGNMRTTDDNAPHGHLDSDIEKAQYNHSTVVKEDIHNVVAAFKDFRSSNENVLCQDGSLKNLLQLQGTIPIMFKRKKYSIPILLLFMDDHPYLHPTVYVRPTSTMQIKSGRSVDKNGKVDIPYLREWNYPDTDPVTMIHALILTFSEELPLTIPCGTTSDNPRFVSRQTTDRATDSVLLGSDEA